MADNKDVMACPLCQGHGQLRRAALDEWLSDPDLRGVIERFIAQCRDRTPRTGEQVFATEKKNSDRDFEKEVHRWNPELPIFRRSPKE